MRSDWVLQPQPISKICVCGWSLKQTRNPTTELNASHPAVLKFSRGRQWSRLEFMYVWPYPNSLFYNDVSRKPIKWIQAVVLVHMHTGIFVKYISLFICLFCIIFSSVIGNSSILTHPKMHIPCPFTLTLLGHATWRGSRLYTLAGS